jgi:hypothetical protein
MRKLFFILTISILFWSCKSTKQSQKQTKITVSALKFIGEQIIPENTYIDSVLVGGLSSIDYAQGKYYAICDDKNKPVRFYELALDYDLNGFYKILINKQININSKIKEVDPEALRYDINSSHFIWTSEGAIRRGVSPAIFEISNEGDFVKEIPIASQFQAQKGKQKGPRQNGTFECLSMAEDSNFIWIGMELPLREDGEEPTLKKGKYPVRISKINKNSGEIIFQFVYELNAIPKDSKPAGKFRVNGMPEILALGNKQFLVIERAYASGYDDGGNTVKIFKVNAENATDVKAITALKNSNYIASTKTLVLDFESIRPQLTNGVVDNIEGITFGKKLANGHQSLIVISDDNFRKFSPQLNQIIVFEVIP